MRKLGIVVLLMVVLVGCQTVKECQPLAEKKFKLAAGVSLNDLIEAGNYHTVDKFYLDRISGAPLLKSRRAILLSFPCSAKTEKVLSYIKKRGYCPGTLSDLIAFGATEDQNIKNVVVALGDTTWTVYDDGVVRIDSPAIFSMIDNDGDDNYHRFLSSSMGLQYWSSGYYFLAVKP
jgi:hypothetical protein